MQQASSAAVSADALPTAQINGVVWTQLVVGDTVFAGGQFSSARPAGAPAGTNEVPRANLLAYNLRTGELVQTFAPTFNAQVKALAVSPDGTTLYAGGDFTQANGVTRNRIAAVDTTTGALRTNFAPVVNYHVEALATRGPVVYLGGAFNSVNGVGRSRLASVTAATGALTTWAPVADNSIHAMVVSPSGNRVIVGGNFATLNGVSALGTGSLDSFTGVTRRFDINRVVQNSGLNSGIYSLSITGSSVYATGWRFGKGGNLEGTFAADAETGAIHWIDDCNGDTYSNFAVNGYVYTVGHAHDCSTIGGFPNYAPNQYHRAIAMADVVSGVLGTNAKKNPPSLRGRPASALVNWFPVIPAGTYTGINQGGWSITGNANFVAMGGEFPSVNGVPQEGLVRFAVRSAAPNKMGPTRVGANWLPTATASVGGTVALSFPANTDPDDLSLTYNVYRDAAPNPVWTSTQDVPFWSTAPVTLADAGLVPGTTYTYHVTATDPSGNVATSASVSVVAA